MGYYLPKVGTLYPLGQDNVLGGLPPTWTQPGGPGTIVYPQPFDSAAGQFEPPLIPIGMYIFGCSHAFNCPAVFKQYNVITEQDAALICCPICGYLQQIIEPYELFDDYVQTPILVS